LSPNGERSTEKKYYPVTDKQRRWGGRKKRRGKSTILGIKKKTKTAVLHAAQDFVNKPEGGKDTLTRGRKKGEKERKGGCGNKS